MVPLVPHERWEPLEVALWAKCRLGPLVAASASAGAPDPRRQPEEAVRLRQEEDQIFSHLQGGRHRQCRTLWSASCDHTPRYCRRHPRQEKVGCQATLENCPACQAPAEGAERKNLHSLPRPPLRNPETAGATAALHAQGCCDRGFSARTSCVKNHDGCRDGLAPRHPNRRQLGALATATATCCDRSLFQAALSASAHESDGASLPRAPNDFCREYPVQSRARRAPLAWARWAAAKLPEGVLAAA